MRERRFFCDEISGAILTLDKEESLHAVQVLRVREGETVTTFDARGRMRKARIIQASREATRLEAISGIESVPAPRPILRIGTALPKGKRMNVLIEQSAAIGVDELHVVHTSRGQTVFRESMREKWRKRVIEACKQSRRLHAMEILGPREWEAFLKDAAAAPVKLMLHPDEDATPIREVLDVCGKAAVVAALVGPEGGFTADETQDAQQHGFRIIRLPTNILRIELAVAALAAIIRCASTDSP